MQLTYYSDSLEHHGVKGQRWGIRRYRNADGSLTSAGRNRYRKEKKSKKAVIYSEKQLIKDSGKKIGKNVAKGVLVVGRAAAGTEIGKTVGKGASVVSRAAGKKITNIGKEVVDAGKQVINGMLR